MNPIRSHLVIAGHLGIDVHLVEERELYLRPAGSAYNPAVGVLAAGGAATVIGSMSRSFPARALDKFDRTGVRILTGLAGTGPDHAFLYGLLGARGPVISLGRPSAPPIEPLFRSSLKSVHLHLGTMPVDELRLVAEEARRALPSASISSTLYVPYLQDALERGDPVFRHCALLFLNADELSALRAIPELLHRLAGGRILVVTCGPRGAIAFVDGIAVHAFAPAPRSPVNAVGAGDVFAGALLAGLLGTRRLSDAVVRAVEISARTVGAYGVEDAPVEVGAGEEEQVSPADLPLVPVGSFDPGSEDPRAEVMWATGLFVLRDGEILLATKRDEDAFVPGRLYVPGGKVEPGETPLECARRELREETGLTGTRFVELGEFHYPDPRRPGRLYRFTQYAVPEFGGTPAAAGDLANCQWRSIDGLRREELFDLTWAQLTLLRLVPRSDLSGIG